MMRRFCKSIKEKALCLYRDERGANGIELLLLMAVIAIPSWYIMELCIDTLVAHYQMMSFINSLPFP